MTRDEGRGTSKAIPVALLVPLLFLSFLSLLLPDRPPLAHTGGFGEPTCVTCHFSNSLNDPAGTLRLDGLPATYQPGRGYVLAFALSKPGLLRSGFELAARWADGPGKGRQAGRLEPADTRTDVTDTVLAAFGRVQYARHTRDGSEPRAPETAGWAVKWTAPTELAGAVVFHVVANAGNGDDSPLDDFIYVASLLSKPVGERGMGKGETRLRLAIPHSPFTIPVR